MIPLRSLRGKTLSIVILQSNMILKSVSCIMCMYRPSRLRSFFSLQQKLYEQNPEAASLLVVLD